MTVAATEPEPETETPDAATEQTESPSRSRENALTHGLTGAGLVLPSDMGLRVGDRVAQYNAAYQPQSLHDHDLVYQAALGIVRFNTIQPMLSHRAACRARQAETDWPMLRAMEAHERSKRLAYDPIGVIDQLKGNIGGVEWLIREWQFLEMALKTPDGWTARQVELAQKLVGIPRAHRHLDPEKVREGTLDERQALVDRQLDELTRLRRDPVLAERDEAERQGIIQQLDGYQDPTVDRLHRYEQRALRLHKNAIRQLEERASARQNAEPNAPPPAPPAITPPMLGRLSIDDYIRQITNIDSIKRIPLERVPEPDHPFRKQMAAWIETTGLDLDVVASLRGLQGYLTRWLEREFGFWDDQAPETGDEDGQAAARLARAARKKSDQDRKDRRQAQALARKRRR